MRALVAWRRGLFLTEGKIVVLSVSSLFLSRVRVYVCVSVCIVPVGQTTLLWAGSTLIN